MSLPWNRSPERPTLLRPRSGRQGRNRRPVRRRRRRGVRGRLEGDGVVMATKARRAPGAGHLFVKRDTAGRESWYGKWYADGRQVKRKIGAKRGQNGHGHDRREAERRLRKLVEEQAPPSAPTALRPGSPLPRRSVSFQGPGGNAAGRVRQTAPHRPHALPTDAARCPRSRRSGSGESADRSSHIPANSRRRKSNAPDCHAWDAGFQASAGPSAGSNPCLANRRFSPLGT